MAKAPVKPLRRPTYQALIRALIDAENCMRTASASVSQVTGRVRWRLILAADRARNVIERSSLPAVGARDIKP